MDSEEEEIGIFEEEAVALLGVIEAVDEEMDSEEEEEAEDVDAAEGVVVAEAEDSTIIAKQRQS